MKTRAVISSVAAAGLTLAVMPLGCGAAQDDYELVSRPSGQTSASENPGQFPAATARQAKTCVEHGAARLPKSSSVRFDVEPNEAGKVVKFGLRQSTLQDTEVEECVRQAIAKMTVPAHALGMRSSGPVSGGERMTREQRGPIGSESDSNNPFVLWIVVEAVGVETLIEVGVGVIAAIGTIVVPRERSPREKCQEPYSDCLMSSVASRRGSVHGHTLCLWCFEACVGNGGTWPASVPGIGKNVWHSCE